MRLQGGLQGEEMRVAGKRVNARICSLKGPHEAQSHRMLQMTTFQPSVVHLHFEVALHATPNPTIPAPQSSYALVAA